jgi:hypothetical protein
VSVSFRTETDRLVSFASMDQYKEAEAWASKTPREAMIAWCAEVGEVDLYEDGALPEDWREWAMAVYAHEHWPLAQDRGVPGVLALLDEGMRRKPFWCGEPEIRATPKGYVAQYKFDCRVQEAGVFPTEQAALWALKDVLAGWYREADANAASEGDAEQPAQAPKRRRTKPVDRRQQNLLLPVTGGIPPESATDRSPSFDTPIRRRGD